MTRAQPLEAQSRLTAEALGCRCVAAAAGVPGGVGRGENSSASKTFWHSGGGQLSLSLSSSESQLDQMRADASARDSGLSAQFADAEQSETVSLSVDVVRNRETATQGSDLIHRWTPTTSLN